MGEPIHIDPGSPPIKAIRDLLLDGFTARGLQMFCYDRDTFRPVTDEFRDPPALAESVSKLIEYCDKHVLWDELLAGIAEANPEQYARHAPSLSAPRPTAPTMPAQQPKAMAGMDNAHALIAGIAAYQNVNHLPPTVLQDARDVRDVIVDGLRCGYPPGNVQLLLDGEATNAGLRGALARLAECTTVDSTVFIYVSCHGLQIASGSYSGEYLLPVDVDASSEDAVAASAISGRDFSEALHAIPARKLLVILDCCHAGGIGEPKGLGAAEVKAGLPEAYYDALVKGKGRAILASSRSTERSWVMPGSANSLFTQHLLAGLGGEIASEDGLVRVFDLFEFVQPRVTADRPDQHPVFKAELEDNYPVALYLGGQKGVVARDESGFRFDAYVSYLDREPDTTWVWDTLVPRLEAAELRIAVSGDVEQPGVARVVGIERGIRQAKRTLIVLSDGYLADHMGEFENTLAQTMGIQEGSYRLLPVQIGPVDAARLPVRLSQLTTLDLGESRRAERNWARLIDALEGPLPTF